MSTPKEKAAAQTWIKRYARSVNSDYEEMMEVADQITAGRDASLSTGDQQVDTDPEFWAQYRIVRDINPDFAPDNGGDSFFRCAC